MFVTDAGLTRSLTVVAPTVLMMWSNSCSVKTTRRRDGIVPSGGEELRCRVFSSHVLCPSKWERYVILSSRSCRARSVVHAQEYFHTSALHSHGNTAPVHLLWLRPNHHGRCYKR
jgi:hypothetical protein